MSITFELEIRGTVEALNLSNPNAAALMTLAGLAPQAAGEVRGESLRACGEAPARGELRGSPCPCDRRRHRITALVRGRTLGRVPAATRG